MPNQEELERLDLNTLAVYCLRVAESQTSGSLKADQARQLKSEWALFIGHRKPLITGLETPEDLEAYAKQLKQRMVSFLADHSQGDVLLSQNAPPANGNARRSAAGGGS